MHSDGKPVRYNWHTDCDSIDSRQFNDMAIKAMASKGTAWCKLNSMDKLIPFIIHVHYIVTAMFIDVCFSF